MKILFVGRNCQVGGGSTFRYRASLGLIPLGHQITLVAAKGAMAPDFRALGVRHVQVPQSPFNRARLITLLRSERFDLIHSVTPTAGDDVAFALRFVDPKKRPAWVLSIHGVLPAQVKTASDNPCLLGADEVICFDDFALKRLRSIPGMEHREIHQVPRPVEEHPMPASAREEALGSKRLVMVSRLSKSKGKTALRALEAVEALLPEFPDLHLKIIGDGSQHADIARRCAELNARVGREIASAPGFLVHPFGEMARARAVIGTAYVALEALFHGIPVVASGYEAFGLVTPQNLDEAVACNFGDGYPGLHAEPTRALFEDGFRRILENAFVDEDAQIAERVRARHSIPAVAGRLETIYNLARAKRAATLSSS